MLRVLPGACAACALVVASAAALPRPAGAALSFRQFEGEGRDARASTDTFTSVLPLHPTRYVQSLMLVALAGGGLRARRMWRRLAGALDRTDTVWLAACTMVAVGLRLWGGVRIPGHVNGHGYEHVYDLLYWQGRALEYHGNASDALHGLVLWLLPRTEASVVAIQLACSVLAVPGMWAVGRLWTGSRDVGRWAAVVAAVLPAWTFYGMTEERFVPGVATLLATLAVLGVAARDYDPVEFGAAAVLAAVTAHFQPGLIVVPLIALIFLATSPGRPALGTPWPWLAAVVFVALSADPIVQALSRIGTGGGPQTDIVANLPSILSVLRPEPPDLAIGRGSVFLASAFTPPTFAALAAAGVAWGIAVQRPRGAVAGMLACAVIQTVPGMVGTGMNTARLQLPALAFFGMLAAAGLAAATWVIGRLGGAWRVAAAPLAAAGVAGSLAVWPGPLGARFTPQHERQVFADGLSSVPDGCAVLLPRPPGGGFPLLPYYLVRQERRNLVFATVGPDLDPASLPDCTYWYRPSTCHELRDPGGALVEMSESGLRRSCADVEARLALEPAFVRDVPARPDYAQAYARDRLAIGFFRAGVRRPSGRSP